VTSRVSVVEADRFRQLGLAEPCIVQFGRVVQGMNLGFPGAMAVRTIGVNRRNGDAGDSDAYLPLVTSEEQSNVGAGVLYLGPDPFAVLAEAIVASEAQAAGVQAWALPAPVMIQIGVPSGNWDKEQGIIAKGPGGAIRVKLPQDAVPGSMVTCKLGPKPEYRIQVPPGASQGYVIRFLKANMEDVTVQVPQGLQPGDSFDVTPPALVVRTPETAKAGDYVVISQIVRGMDGPPKEDFFKVCVPDGVQPMEHFAALLPGPEMDGI